MGCYHQHLIIFSVIDTTSEIVYIKKINQPIKWNHKLQYNVSDIIEFFKKENIIKISESFESLLKNRDKNRIDDLLDKLIRIDNKNYLEIFNFLLEDLSHNLEEEDFYYYSFAIPYLINESNVEKIDYQKIHGILIEEFSDLPIDFMFSDELFALKDMMGFLNPEECLLYDFTHDLIRQSKEQMSENICFNYKTNKMKHYPLDNFDFSNSVVNELKNNGNKVISENSDIRFIVGVMKEAAEFSDKRKTLKEKNPCYLFLKNENMSKKIQTRLDVVVKNLLEETKATLIYPPLPILDSVERILANINMLRFKSKFSEMQKITNNKLITHLLFSNDGDILEIIVFTDNKDNYIEEMNIDYLPFLTEMDTNDLQKIIIESSHKIYGYDGETKDMMPKPNRFQLN